MSWRWGSRRLWESQDRVGWERVARFRTWMGRSMERFVHGERL